MSSFPLDEIAEVIRGITFSKAEGTSEEEVGRIPVIRAGSIQTSLLLNEGQIWVPSEKVKKHQLIRKDDIIMCTSSGSANLVGKCAKSTHDWNGSFGAFCAGIRPNKSKCDPSYLYHFLCTPAFRNWTKSSSGANIKNIRASELAKFQIPLPYPDDPEKSLKEQKRIAAILDKADGIRRKRQQAIQLADDFLRSVFLDMFGDPVTNPKGWPVNQIKVGLQSITSGWSAKGESTPCNDGGLGVLKISAVTSGTFKPSENKAVNREAVPANKQLIFPKRGDLIFSRANTRELVAATCIVQEDRGDVFLPDKLWLVKTDNCQLLPEFLNFLIWHPKFKELLTSQATGTSGSMLNISKAKFESTETIFPGLTTQNKFKDIYWKTLATLEGSISSEKNIGNLFDSLSSKAFSGEL